MIKRIVCLVSMFYGFLAPLTGQFGGSGTSTLSTLISNPAVSGVEGDGIMRISYSGIYPGSGYGLNSIKLSYDSFFSSVHGGVAFFLSNDKRGGIINDLYGGFSYSYHFRAGDDLYISAGLSAALFHRGFNFNDAVLPDQIDPVGGASFISQELLANRSIIRPDLSTGFLFMYDRYYAGISVSHLAQPEITGGDFGEVLLYRKLLVHLGGNIEVDGIGDMKLCPVVAIEMDKDNISAAIGGSVGINPLSLSALLVYQNRDNLDIQTSLHLSLGNVDLFYSYMFNIISGNNILPISLHHQVGLAIGLYSVDKRKSVNAIIFPKI